jgi:hypothetical protein
MPRGDRTGPWGAGSMTGRAAGYCAGYPVPGYMNLGRGWGRGFGRGWYVYPPPVIVQPSYPPVITQQSSEQDVAALENYQKELVAEKADLEKEMDDIKARIEELKAKIEKTET